ncbi:DegT/DnrJ/EryC1/StrS family aminotransferase [Salinithrix halophila]|uniref:DegT/DnrJ/EryC1/StrS family aminotransferase n=1 Tax=Salinithrix halophila TaxID=1485204 RepID=A0ABV8JDI4_9BACL
MEPLAIHGGPPVRKAPYPDWPVFGVEEQRQLTAALYSGKWGGTGERRTGERPVIEELEERFARFHDAAYGVTLVNGTMAILVALQAAGVKTGDEVIMPPYTFIATASAPLLFGAIPVFVDVEEETLLLDPDKVESAITPRTKAIIAVHIAGAVADMTRLKDLADSYGLALIEDAAQAHGAQWEGKGVGALGHLGIFSFQSSKNMTAGEGGIILSNDRERIDRAWSLANVGRVRGGGWYQHERIGWNLRMTEFQASILLAQLDRLKEQLHLREKNAALLEELLGKVEGIRLIRRDPRVTRHAYHLYMFCLSPDRMRKASLSKFIRAVQAEGVPVVPGYPPLNRNPSVLRSIRDWAGEDRLQSCPVAEELADRQVMWLKQPILLTDGQGIRDVARAVEKVAAWYR